MDTAALLQIISIAAFSLSGLLFIASVILFIKFRIPVIAGDLSGMTAKKQIQVIRNQNTEKGEHRYRPDTANIYKGKPSERLGNSSRLKRRNPTGDSANSGRLVIERAMAESGRLGAQVNLNVPDSPQRTPALSAETAVLSSQNQYEISPPTEVLQSDFNTAAMPATEKLTIQAMELPQGAGSNTFQMLKEITLIHTEETI